MVTVRRARLSDAKRICEINEYALGYAYPLQSARRQIKRVLGNKENLLLVACLSGLAVGYIHGAGYDCTYADALKNILAIAVLEQYRGKGIGRRLLSAVEDWAKETGCSGVRLVSGHDRTQAHEFYARCGYGLRKEQKNFIKYFNA